MDIHFVSSIITCITASVTVIVFLYKFIIKNQSKVDELRPFLAKTISTPYIFKSEIFVIVISGVLLNYVGILLTGNVGSVLFFDMLGTAFAAFLLGPWWGAITGLLSNSLINFFGYPLTGGADPLDIIFPWALVNMAGGIFWGFLSRGAFIKEYLREEKPALKTHIYFLLLFGVASAFIMNIPGVFIPIAINKPEIIMIHTPLAHAINSIFGNSSNIILDWLLLSIFSIPDKSITAIFALILIRVAFPLFERELIHGGICKYKIEYGWLSPVVGILVYCPIFLVFIFLDRYNFNQYWILWICPFLIFITGMIIALVKKRGNYIYSFAKDREELYKRVGQIINNNIRTKLYTRLEVITLIVAIFFLFTLISLDMKNTDLWHLLINFSITLGCVFFGTYMYKISTGQNAIISPTTEAIKKIEDDLSHNKSDNIRNAIIDIHLPLLKLDNTGKTKYFFVYGDNYLMITTDKITAFDKVIPTPIPEKGKYQILLTKFWYSKLKNANPHNIVSGMDEDLTIEEEYKKRSLMVKKIDIIPFEFIVRKYVIGSIWNEYSQNGTINGAKMTNTYKFGDELDKPIFTITTKDDKEDLPVSDMNVCIKIGEKRLEYIKNKCIKIFNEAYDFCSSKNVMLCDAKFVFGILHNENGEEKVLLANEILTPDVARFAKKDGNTLNISDAYDKSLVFKYLKEIGWSSIDPLPSMPNAIVLETQKRYKELYEILTK